MLTLKPEEERRQKPRRRLGRIAAMQFRNDGPQHYCLVTNISEGGVQLRINGVNVPDDFTLLFPEEDSIQNGYYKVVWRNGLDLGAKFVGSATLK